jgi:hypothetical protein
VPGKASPKRKTKPSAKKAKRDDVAEKDFFDEIRAELKDRSKFRPLR